jgi:hypothetical protein
MAFASSGVVSTQWRIIAEYRPPNEPCHQIEAFAGDLGLYTAALSPA